MLSGLATPVCHAVFLGSCSVPPVAVNLGPYSPLAGSALTAQSTLTLNCNAGVSLNASVGISFSGGLSGNALTRSLKQGGHSLAYNLYTSNLYTEILGDGSGGTSRLTGTIQVQQLFSSTQSWTIYARLPAGQVVPAGAYADNVSITVTID
ncbi:spore coat U domain-containing protein [Jeongeupia sp. USM3]|uniref:Csu type fimbrial protein n=1 Tax=Jeongeupia sp. USM3 TaxID=1906741 RepID=UPI00089DF953|nr:spore coat U domain-containing protein [Jeongeupia sp. USM3]AOY02257.1 hypothetical protein BJP62_07755 [Jeongeupia sp. USM3]